MSGNGALVSSSFLHLVWETPSSTFNYQLSISTQFQRISGK